MNELVKGIGTILVLAVAVGGGGSTKKHATTQSTGEPLPALQAGGYGIRNFIK